MQTKQNSTPMQISKSLSSIRKIKQTTPPNPEQEPDSVKIWTAHPTTQATIPAFHKAQITLRPVIGNEELNAANGRKILIRKCPCI